MKSKLVFESDDGVLFDSEDECREWEVVRERIKRFYVNGFLRDDLPAWFSECWDEEGLQFILGLSYAEPKTADQAGDKTFSHNIANRAFLIPLADHQFG